MLMKSTVQISVRTFMVLWETKSGDILVVFEVFKAIRNTYSILNQHVCYYQLARQVTQFDIRTVIEREDSALSEGLQLVE